jgi:hypothetical protein
MVAEFEFADDAMLQQAARALVIHVELASVAG